MGYGISQPCQPDKSLFGAPMPSLLGKVPPKGADEVCNFAKQNCIAEGNWYGDFETYSDLTRPSLCSGHPPQRGGHMRSNSNLSLCLKLLCQFQKSFAVGSVQAAHILRFACKISGFCIGYCSAVHAGLSIFTFHTIGTKTNGLTKVF